MQCELLGCTKHIILIHLTILKYQFSCDYPYFAPVRSCWGPEERHTETVAWFLDNGVPLDDIYDKCLEMTTNSNTEAMLKSRKGGNEL